PARDPCGPPDPATLPVRSIRPGRTGPARQAPGTGPAEEGGTGVRIGYVLPMGDDTRPNVPASPAELVALAREVESAGLDSVWTFDHLLVQESPDGPPAGTWEAWTVLTAIAAQTSRVGLGVLVSCTGFREPIVTAKITHTLQELSDGR